MTVSRRTPLRRRAYAHPPSTPPLRRRRHRRPVLACGATLRPSLGRTMLAGGATHRPPPQEWRRAGSLAPTSRCHRWRGAPLSTPPHRAHGQHRIRGGGQISTRVLPSRARTSHSPGGLAKRLGVQVYWDQTGGPRFGPLGTAYKGMPFGVLSGPAGLGCTAPGTAYKGMPFRV